MAERKIQLVYDTQCPACDFYCKQVDLEGGAPELVDARDHPAVLDEITARHWDIDEGMVLKLDDELYYGAEAIHQLALLSPRRGLFNRLNRLAFGGRRRATWLYPVFRACRNLLLKLLGKTRINNLGKPNRDRF